MTFKPDLCNFKTVCQCCGKTGHTDFDKPQYEDGWILQYLEDDDFEIEYYLCDKCYDEHEK